MTTTTATQANLKGSAGRPRATLVHPVTLTRLVSSERIKLFSLKSTFWILGVVAALWVGFTFMFVTVVISQAHENNDPAAELTRFARNASEANQIGIQFAQLALAVLGVMIITSEYSTGMIRSTFAAAPKRLGALWAKGIVLTVITFVFTLVMSFICYGITAALFSAEGYPVSLSNPFELQRLFGGPLYLTLLTLFALSVGTLIRNTAGAVSAVMGTILVLPVVASFIPRQLGDTIMEWLPTTAGSAILLSDNQVPGYGQWGGLAIFAGYVIVLMAASAILLKRRDT